MSDVRTEIIDPKEYFEVFKDEPVTWHSLLEVLSQVKDLITDYTETGIESISKALDAVKNFAQELYNESEYRRMRSMAFVLAMAGYQDYNKWRPIYDKFCDDYDKLNRKERQNE